MAEKFTVAELIEVLQKLDSNASVRLQGCCGSACGYWSGEVREIGFDVNGKRIEGVEYILDRKER